MVRHGAAYMGREKAAQVVKIAVETRGDDGKLPLATAVADAGF